VLNYPPAIQNLIDSFCDLPGIGRKTAERFVFYLLKQNKAKLQTFAQNLNQLEINNFICPACYNFSGKIGLCPICLDNQRDKTLLCVVEEFSDVKAIENTGDYKGLYHVLGGKIDLALGINSNDLRISELLERLKNQQIKEIILALDPDMAGETTVLHLKKLLSPLHLKVTLLARGLPMGATLEYADEVTLSKAFKGRQEI